MKLTDILSVSGLPGLFKMIANRSNGLMLSEIGTGKSKFASIRKHQFTPLETIAIYTMEDTVELKKVLDDIKTLDDKTPIGEEKKTDEEIKALFTQIVPDYDPDRVYLKDMKKLFSWYKILKTNNLLIPDDKESDEEE